MKLKCYFLARYLSARQGQAQIGNLTTKTTQPKLALTRIEQIRIPLPPLHEQQVIAQALRTVQEAREVRRREAALERERKAALMQYLFTHGTRGEARKETEIGEVPESWRVVRLGEVARVVSGGTPERVRPEYWGGNIPWVKTGEINYNIINETEEQITKLGLENSSARVIPAGTLLMAMYGQGVTRGRVAILGIDAAINQACAAMITDGSVTTDFLFFALTLAYDRIRDLGHGANQKNLNAALIRSIQVPLPSEEEQSQIAETLRACDDKIAALDREAAGLEELFRAMLEALMTGRLRVAGLVA